MELLWGRREPSPRDEARARHTSGGCARSMRSTTSITNKFVLAPRLVGPVTPAYCDGPFLATTDFALSHPEPEVI